MAAIVVKGAKPAEASNRYFGSEPQSKIINVAPGVRPTKQAEIPPPYYLTAPASAPPAYCHTCGRIVGERKQKTAKASSTPSRYCSDRCKTSKPSASSSSLDRVIEDTLWRLLEQMEMKDVVGSLPEWVRVQYHTSSLAPPSGSDEAGGMHEVEVEDRRDRRGKKGDARVLVPCSLVETVVFGRESHVSRGQGRRKRARDEKTGRGDEANNTADAGYDESALLAALERFKGLGKVTEGTESESEIEDLGEKEKEDRVATGEDETGGHENMDDKRKQGQRQAEQRERVRNACRRAVVFGLRQPTGGEMATHTDIANNKGHKNYSGKNAPTQDSMADWTSDEEGRKAVRKSRRSRASVQKSNGDHQPDRTNHTTVLVDGEERKLAEAIMGGELAEPSFCKGEWGVRWREKY